MEIRFFYFSDEIAQRNVSNKYSSILKLCKNKVVINDS